MYAEWPTTIRFNNEYPLIYQGQASKAKVLMKYRVVEK